MAEEIPVYGRDMDDICPITRNCTNQQSAHAKLTQLYADGKYEEYKELLCKYEFLLIFNLHLQKLKLQS